MVHILNTRNKINLTPWCILLILFFFFFRFAKYYFPFSEQFIKYKINKVGTEISSKVAEDFIFIQQQKQPTTKKVKSNTRKLKVSQLRYILYVFKVSDFLFLLFFNLELSIQLVKMI